MNKMEMKEEDAEIGGPAMKVQQKPGQGASRGLV